MAVLVATVGGSAACSADPAETNRWTDGAASSAPAAPGAPTPGTAAPDAAAPNASTPGAAGPGAAGPAWTEPRAYGFVLESTCGEPALIGRFRVAVADGRVTRVEGLDESARRAARTSESELVPTLGQLVEAAATAREDGAEVVRTDADPTDGHPTRVTIDPAVDGVDDGSCYAVSEYTVGVRPAATP